MCEYRALRVAISIVVTEERGVTEPATDEVLMAAYQAGNQAAFTELYERYGGGVYGLLARRAANRALADDLYQEVFLRVHRARHTYDRARPFRAWLFGIVHNLLIDSHREQERMPRIRVVEQAPSEGSNDVDVQIVASSSSTEDEAIRREAARALAHAVRVLAPDEATVLVLARIEGLSYDDIAFVIGRSATATKQLAYRALKRVRAELTAAGHGEGS